MKNRPHNKEVRELIEQAILMGCLVSGGGDKHYKVRCPNGQSVVIGASPNKAGVRDAKAHLRRQGISI